MTRKDKKEEALRLKAEIEAKKPKPEKTEVISKELLEKGNRDRYKDRKARNSKKKTLGTKKQFNKWDLERW